MLTIQYKNDSLLRWVQVFNCPANADDFATALAIDNKDNVYITGDSTGIGTSLNYAAIKYTSQGNLEWTQRYNGSANGHDQANAIALDSLNNVYVTGLSFGSDTDYFEFATVKYAHTISLNYSNAELELQYNGSVTDKGMLSVNLVVRDTNNNIIIATDMKIDVTSFAYRLSVNKPLIKESKKLVKLITQEKAVSIANALQELIVEYSSNHNVNDFKNEQLEGLFYYHAVFRAIDRYIETNLDYTTVIHLKRRTG